MPHGPCTPVRRVGGYDYSGRRSRRCPGNGGAGSGVQGGANDVAAVGGTGGRGYRRACVPAARVRRLSAPARSGPADHLPGYPARAGERDHPAARVRPAAGPGVPVASVVEHESGAYPGPDVAGVPRHPGGARRRGGRRGGRLRRVRVGPGVSGRVAPAHADRDPRGERPARGGQQDGYALHPQRRGRLPIPDRAGTGVARGAGDRGTAASGDRAPGPGRTAGAGPGALRAGPGPADPVRLRRLPGRPVDQPGHGGRGQGADQRRDPGAAHHGRPQRTRGDPARSAQPVRDGEVPRRHGARVRGRRPGPVPGRGDDVCRDRRRRYARHLRPATLRKRRAAPQRAARGRGRGRDPGRRRGSEPGLDREGGGPGAARPRADRGDVLGRRRVRPTGRRRGPALVRLRGGRRVSELTAEDLGTVHLVGVGGVGMSGLARLLLTPGIPVSGSELRDWPQLAGLRALGGTIHMTHEPANLDGVDTVVYSTAIPQDHLELVEARARGLRVMHRAEALAATMTGRRAIAIAGTHGKTTTTSMTTLILQHAGLDPSFVIGGEISEVGSNAHHGSGEHFVVEADESDRSFLLYKPFVAIVTNIEADHLNTYGTVEALADAFLEFCRNTEPGGFVVTCADEPATRELADAAREANLTVYTYGEAEDADLRITEVTSSVRGVRYLAGLSGEPLGEVALPVPGRHLGLNSAAAVLIALKLGVPIETIVAALAAFPGVRRRFELKGTADGVRGYDGDAYHPTPMPAATRTPRGG